MRIYARVSPGSHLVWLGAAGLFPRARRLVPVRRLVSCLASFASPPCFRPSCSVEEPLAVAARQLDAGLMRSLLCSAAGAAHDSCLIGGAEAGLVHVVCFSLSIDWQARNLDTCTAWLLDGRRLEQRPEA